MAGAICRSMEILDLENVSEKERAGENAENARAPETQRNVHMGKMKGLLEGEMDTDLWGSLDRNVLEMVIHRLPPKNIVQSQILSSTWRSKFLSRDFQKEVNSFPSRWGPSISYHPLCLSEKGLFGYDWSSLKWKYLCSLPDFPSDLEDLGAYPEKWRPLIPQTSSWRLRASNCHVSGSLIFSMFTTRASYFDSTRDFSITLSYFKPMAHIMVTNAVNKTVRRLPSLQVKRFSDYCHARPDFYVLVNEDVYEIVIIDHVKEAGILYATVYHSNLSSWTENKSGEMINDHPSLKIKYPGVILRGIIYLSFSSSTYTPECDDAFVTYDVRKGVFEKIVLSAPIRYGRLVVWRDQLMIVVADSIYINYSASPFWYHPVHVSIFKVNLDTLQLTLVSSTVVAGVRLKDVSDWDFTWEIERRFPPSVVGADPECIYMNIESFFQDEFEESHIASRDTLLIPAIFDWTNFPCRSEVSNIHPDTADSTRVEHRILYGSGSGRWLVFNVNQNRWNCFTVSACESEHPGTECINMRNPKASGQMFQPGLNAFVST